MKKLLTFLLIVFASTPVVAQNQIHLPEKAFIEIQQLLSEKFPEYFIVDTIAGEINKDQEMDCIVVLEEIVEHPESDENFLEIGRRTVLLIQKNGKYQVAASNDNIVQCTDCGGAGVGDPYYGITIENGIITFNSFFGACDKTKIEEMFEYNSKKKDWYMIKVTRLDYNCNDWTEEGEIRTTITEETPKQFGKVRFSSFGFVN